MRKARTQTCRDMLYMCTCILLSDSRKDSRDLSLGLRAVNRQDLEILEMDLTVRPATPRTRRCAGGGLLPSPVACVPYELGPSADKPRGRLEAGETREKLARTNKKMKEADGDVTHFYVY